MTGYHISIGYNGANQPLSYAQMWERLKFNARDICDNPPAIIREARRLGSPENCSDGCCPLERLAGAYATPFGDNGNPVSLIESCDVEDCQVMQLASTGEPVKYHIRRAFVRLLIQEMHREGIEVNLNVV